MNHLATMPSSENALEFKAVERKWGASLARVLTRLNAQLDIDTILRVVCEETARALDVPAASINLYDETRNSLYRAEAVGLPPAYLKPGQQTLPRHLYERYAREDVTIRGVTIPQGEMTLGVIGSANRDETAFENPDRLDLTRENNKHLGFGYGIHFCLGAPLARLEAQIAINTLLRRLPNLALKNVGAPLSWRPGLILRGLEALPVRF